MGNNHNTEFQPERLIDTIFTDRRVSAVMSRSMFLTVDKF